MTGRQVTILIPAHNEESRIGQVLESHIQFFDNIEILVAMDGCTDRTLDVVKSYTGDKTNGNIIRYIHFEERKGKGGGLIQGFRRAEGDIIAVTDADMSTSPKEILRLITELDGCECVIGSRWLPGSVVCIKQPLRRRIASRCFNILVRILLGLPYKDTQCGTKVLRKEAVTSIIDSIDTFDFAFDVDLLYRLHKKGYKIKEVPIVWDDKKGSSIRLTRTSITMFLAIVRLRFIDGRSRPLIKVKNTENNNILDYVRKKMIKKDQKG